MVKKIIAIPTFGEGGLQSQINPRFGRCESFTFVNVENNEIKSVNVISNAAAGTMGGAGIQAAQIIGNNDATDIIVGMLGPNAFQALSSINLKIFTVGQQSISVNEAVKLLLKERLTLLNNANVQAHTGMGGGRMGRGVGGRRSMG